MIKELMANFARGGIKAIPSVGPWIEQTVFGTVDGVETKRESAKIADALSRIQRNTEGQEVTLIAVLESVKSLGDLSATTTSQIDELISAIRDLEKKSRQERVGIQLDGGTLRSSNLQIRNQARSIVAKNTDIELESTEIE